jgi:5'-nucleotidase
MEGRNLGFPAIAVSIASFQPQYFSTAVDAVVVLLRQLSDFGGKSDTILNINVPDIPWEKIKGFQATRLGRRHEAEPVIKSKDPRGNTIYWVGRLGKQQDAGEGTDFYAVQQRYISVTPLHVDLTRHHSIRSTATWLETI